MNINPSQPRGWDKLISEREYNLFDPDPLVIRFVEKRAEEGCRSTLDLGCGLGRHTRYLESKQITTCAMDISGEAVNSTEELLSRDRLHRTICQGDMLTLPFRKETFDLVLAWRVLHLERRTAILKAAREIVRVLKPGAYLYASMRSTENTLFSLGKRHGREIEPNTYLMGKGALEGMVYHFFNAGEIKELFRDLSVLELEEMELEHTSYTAQYEDLKNSFWILTARKP